MENIANNENVMTILLAIAFFAWLYMKDQKGAGE